MQNFGRENFDDSTCIRQNSSDFSTVKVLRYTLVVPENMLFAYALAIAIHVFELTQLLM